jgi:signal peptidase I
MGMAWRLLKGETGMENPSIGRLATIGGLSADMSSDRDDGFVGSWWDYTIAWVKTVLTAAVYTKLIVLFLFQVARVDGQSMAPTLADHDRLIVNKFTYQVSAPRMGDIVMFYYPANPDEAFVKRIIAEEGDTVRIAAGHVYVNDRPLDDSYVPAAYRSHENFGPETVRAGYYFVLGDHRNDSSDSREWGLVPKKYIVGKVDARWWPLTHARVF